MRHYSKVHGKHCYLRSFKTSCRKCGADVLYWECTHGCRVFFEYPPYGKLIRHHCRPMINKACRNKYKVIVKTPKKMFDPQIVFNCPVCGKSFKTKNSLEDHIHELKNIDKAHKNFSENKFSIEEDKDNKKILIYQKPKFGKINIKNKKDCK